jgi:choline monooxygenase
MAEFEIDPDIRKARTLPSRFYTDAAFFELSKERIFAKSWQLLGRSDEFAQLEPRTILPEFLDEPILISKNDDRIKCLSNVCTHRGKILVEQPTTGSLIRCGYHGRRFSLDGKFLSMPEFEGVKCFPSDSDDLTEYETANWKGFCLASLDATTDFVEFVGDAVIQPLDVADANLKLSESKAYEVNAHWALYCENYLEGFHIPYVHKGLNEIVDYGSYRTELYRYSSLQTGFDDSGEVAGKYLFVFPNMMFNFYPWGISINVVEPVTPSRSRIRYLTYVCDETKLGTGAGGDLHRVEIEDEAVVESVQKGIRSRHYERGRYSPSREQGTHHFHRLIAEFVG